ncbi:MAG TPA: class I SAM-dependent methyltransferase [Gaiellaceae bacterium]|nr:class I SAM-dependent methyltransferase [Gaiellaceae bacterium]
MANPELLRLEQRRRIRSTMLAHDMVEDPDEGYYRDRYWAWIETQTTRHHADLSGAFLDAGCGSGRLTLPLARLIRPNGGRVIGVDLLPESLGAARDHASAEGLANVEFRQGDLLEFLVEQPAESFAGALFLEVGYQVFDLPGHLEQLHRVLRPGGVLLASFRTQYYLALIGVRQRDWQLTETVLRSHSGHLRGMGWQNWHSAGDAVALLEKCGFSETEVTGLGLCSGIAGDPLAAVARPSTMGAADLEGLASVETALAASHPDTGRYLLASAVRTP